MSSSFMSMTDVTKKILSRDSNYLVDMVMRPKFGISNISSMRSYRNLNFIRIRPEKPLFLRAGLGSSSITLDWH